MIFNNLNINKKLSNIQQYIKNKINIDLFYKLILRSMLILICLYSGYNRYIIMFIIIIIGLILKYNTEWIYSKINDFIIWRMSVRLQINLIQEIYGKPIKADLFFMMMIWGGIIVYGFTTSENEELESEVYESGKTIVKKTVNSIYGNENSLDNKVIQTQELINEKTRNEEKESQLQKKIELLQKQNAAKDKQINDLKVDIKKDIDTRVNQTKESLEEKTEGLISNNGSLLGEYKKMIDDIIKFIDPNILTSWNPIYVFIKWGTYVGITLLIWILIWFLVKNTIDLVKQVMKLDLKVSTLVKKLSNKEKKDEDINKKK